MMAADDLSRMRHQWKRVARRVSGGWEKLFTEKVAKNLKNEAWRPSPKQMAHMRDMCRACNADLPDIGEAITLRDGRMMEWVGTEWVEVRR
ncbi:MAG: hypothetical protein ACK4RN_08955 [Pseudorhodobacter sp.]